MISKFLEKAVPPNLRNAIADKVYSDMGIKESEVFISDGAQCDIARLQMLFGPNVTIAVQDPTFISDGQGGRWRQVRRDRVHAVHVGERLLLGPVTSAANRRDVLLGYITSREQLRQLVDFVRGNDSIIVSAYSSYVSTGGGAPWSIYEILGAREVAIEVSPVSKFAGFAGVRLGWARGGARRAALL
ncbi:hypothetical protein GUJ93_ZPchr0013g33896 [Zizania palustris]|uniref:Aminotransferase class I/classII large domain-containing protein n=1 Tax=Zizania palustris TaxID=103762 RepID=A0A8J5WY67_ZIZPA|nr:hypothetical protein GUJ93_ZPchr0013g33896 [Zizania palustris]